MLPSALSLSKGEGGSMNMLTADPSSSRLPIEPGDGMTMESDRSRRRRPEPVTRKPCEAAAERQRERVAAKRAAA